MEFLLVPVFLQGGFTEGTENPVELAYPGGTDGRARPLTGYLYGHFGKQTLNRNDCAGSRIG